VSNLAEYGLMWGVAAVGSALVMLVVRTKIMELFTAEVAGYWEGILRISSYYMLFLSTILSVYYLPKLVKAKSTSEARVVYVNYLTYIMPVFVVGLIALFLMRDFVIQQLFSVRFHPMKPLFFWQMLGDFFKALSLILGYTFFARKLTVAFLFTEILSLLILYCSSIFLLQIYGVTGVVMAHAVTYGIYLAVLVVYFRKTIFSAAMPLDSAEPQ
jgi:PST family polysaccharide transporter